ncbi:hypothetical protein C475_08636 [Halosimplex carlsbadense 2-9-1]|uniref:Uncharacterized protein n=2 Tax=Halosimplex carlsbadense TaxID=171164 RepID=M0CWI6_9EURY|nr:hypothetical protein C475_08636 [Halosimplex carlsbadense 2-9-1]
MLPSTTGVELRVFVDEFEIDDNVSERTELLLDLVLQIYTATEAVAYAYGLDTEHVGSLVEGRELGKPMTDESLAENRINEVSWLMLFGPELVAEYGLEWLLRAPAWKREELDDGAILLVTSPDPTDYEQFSEDRDILRTYFDGRGNDSQYTDRS